MRKKYLLSLAVSIFVFITGTFFPLYASIQAESHAPGFEVEHSIDGHNLDLYFNVKNFSLGQDRGWIVLSIDGQSPVKILSSEKRITGLKSGKHRIKTFLQGKDSGMIGSPIEFDVEIP